jgi:2-dehydro-3-deoxy-D-arabinonate dehydratase
MVIRRGGTTVFEGATRTSQMRRTLPELIEYLFLAEQFPDGVVLSTGTGVVPRLGAGVAAGDEVTISIDEVGTLRSPVVSDPGVFAGLVEGHRPHI